MSEITAEINGFLPVQLEPPFITTGSDWIFIEVPNQLRHTSSNPSHWTLLQRFNGLKWQNIWRAVDFTKTVQKVSILMSIRHNTFIHQQHHCRCFTNLPVSHSPIPHLWAGPLHLRQELVPSSPSRTMALDLEVLILIPAAPAGDHRSIKPMNHISEDPKSWGHWAVLSPPLAVPRNPSQKSYEQNLCQRAAIAGPTPIGLAAGKLSSHCTHMGTHQAWSPQDI